MRQGSTPHWARNTSWEVIKEWYFDTTEIMVGLRLQTISSLPQTEPSGHHSHCQHLYAGRSGLTENFSLNVARPTAVSCKLDAQALPELIFWSGLATASPLSVYSERAYEMAHLGRHLEAVAL